MNEYFYSPPYDGDPSYAPMQGAQNTYYRDIREVPEQSAEVVNSGFMAYQSDGQAVRPFSTVHVD